ncbi:family 10 glycosylhydrolase [Scytonema sp. UIC 10036]|uniref:glycoside hydrolase family 10 protein n=1 Tax=Scytonema sp. UIC 10036 TaxID=2304196 RepID=UPI0012DAF389|nr:family 10 glycosylhydrolase [Scytonema sp. UIC 10036]MUG94478.1 family 10 glycosylhydrolase [Scytonema sp. UIC 10036]
MTSVEIRGVWLTTTDSKVLDSQQNIAEAMQFLAETGFNVVFPVVWTRGTTIYPSQVMQQTFGTDIHPLFTERDPLAELIVEAQRVGLKVIPWLEYGFASSYNLNGGLLLAKKPEWAAIDSEGNLLKKNGFEWLNALDPEVQGFMLSLVLEIVKNYAVDGIQGDDRFPALPSEGGYDLNTRYMYRQQFGEEPPQNPKDKQWLRWRADILTAFLTQLYQEVKAVNPNLVVSIAPNIYDWAYKEYLQDSPTWMEKGLVDIIHPQIYRRDFAAYKGIVDTLVTEQFTDATLPRLAPGILMKVGSYRMSQEYLLQSIQYNRTLGILGEIFFFYEGLRENNNALAQVLRQSPYSQCAAFPSLSDLNRGRVIKKPSFSVFQKLLGFLKNLF